MKRNLGIAALILLSLAGGAAAQDEGDGDGATPTGMAPGAPAGSYALSDIDVINLFNGNLSLRLPLLKIGGRGDTAHEVLLSLEQRWGLKWNKNQQPQAFPRFNYWRGLKPGYGPGTLRAYRYLEPFGGEGLTRFTFNAPDGTQHELRSVVADGAPLGIANNGYRGQVFVTADGTAATYVADVDVYDRIGSLADYTSGRLLWPDGRLYRIDGGLVSYIRDRNGNVISFTYQTPPVFHQPNGGPQVVEIKDSLHRIVSISYADLSLNRWYDEITFKGFGGATRTILVNYSNLDASLAVHDPPYAIQTLEQLFPLLNWGFPDQLHNPKVVTSVTLPDGRGYDFNYNPYGELAEVILPTGGAFRYAYEGGLGGAGDSSGDGIYRRLREKAVYGLGGPEMQTKFDGEQSLNGNQYINVDHYDPLTGTRLSRDVHWFHGLASQELFTGPLEYPSWKHGREHRTETFAVSPGGAETFLRAVDHLWGQNAPVSWWGGVPDEGPLNNPHINETTTTLDTSPAQKSKQTFSYDQYNNRTSVSDYDWGVAAAGPLRRYRVTTYLTVHPAHGVNYAADLNVHLRRLPQVEQVLNANGSLAGQTTYDYDGTDVTFASTATPTGRLAPDTHGLGYQTRGNVTAVRRWVNDPAGELMTRRDHDILGNVTLEWKPGRATYTSFIYSDRYGTPNGEATSGTVPPELGLGIRTFAFASQITNPLGHQTFTQSDYYLGRPVDQQDENGVVTSTHYADLLDRPTQVIVAANTAQAAQTSFTYDDVARVVTTERDRITYGDGQVETSSQYDGLGREIETRVVENVGGSYFAVQKQYDALGRVARVSNPFRPASETPVWTTTTYDALDRVRTVTTPDNAVVTTSYVGGDPGLLGSQTTVTDAASKARRSVADALGRVTRVVEDPQGLAYTTDYVYDALDNLIRVTQGTQVRTFTYDSVSRLRTAANPESGTTTYQYDANGNLWTRTDARAVVTTSSYDDLDRLTSRTYSNGTPTVTYTYDAAAVLYSKGRLTEVHSSVTRNIVDEYDAEGRVKRSRQRTDGKGYRMAYTYDLAGNLTTETYPSGRLVTIAYNRAGRPRNVQDLDKTYVSGVLYSPHGAVTQMTRGNGLFEEATYNLRLQPKTIGLGTSLGNPDKLRIEYGYGNDRAADSATNNGNLTAQTIRVGASTWPQTYNYDGVNRLQSATEGGYWSQGYSYDRWGNRAVISGLVLTPALTPQTLGAFNTANNRLATWVYDQAGNLTQDGLGRTFDYDAENRQTRAVADTYFYDGEGRRVKKVVGGATTTFVYDAFGKLVAEYSGARQFWVSHITSDHLGSTRAVTNDTGVVQSRLDYLPFGEEIPSTVGGRGGVAGYGTDAGIRQKFTGKERDLETGLDYFGARYLSSAQGRFTGPDEPVVFADPDDPQTWNLYTYARNNPHRFVDPDGNDWFTANGEVPLWIDCERNPSGCNAQQAAGWSRWMPTESGHTLLIDYLNGTFRLGVDASGNPTSSYTGPIGMVDTTFSLIPNPQGGVSSLFLAGTVKQSGGMMLRSAAQGQVHHIATNKSVKSGFTKQFARIFKKAGMTLQDAANKVFLLGHKGRHAIRYHQHVLERLSKAVSGKSGAEARNALVKELQLIRQELLRNPDMIRGDFK